MLCIRIVKGNCLKWRVGTLFLLYNLGSCTHVNNWKKIGSVLSAVYYYYTQTRQYTSLVDYTFQRIYIKEYGVVGFPKFTI